MLANERQRQDRSVLQTSKIKDIFKTSTPGTLSPMTTATTSSGYSTGGSSTSTAAISSMKKSSSIGLKKQFPQQQQASSKTKPKGRPEKNIGHVGKIAIDAQMLSIALSQMTFPVCFPIDDVSARLYLSSDLCKLLSVYLWFHSLLRESQQRCEDRSYCACLFVLGGRERVQFVVAYVNIYIYILIC